MSIEKNILGSPYNEKLRVIDIVFEKFHRKTGYIHFGQFEIFEI